MHALHRKDGLSWRWREANLARLRRRAEDQQHRHSRHLMLDPWECVNRGGRPRPRPQNDASKPGVVLLRQHLPRWQNGLLGEQSFPPHLPEVRRQRHQPRTLQKRLNWLGTVQVRSAAPNSHVPLRGNNAQNSLFQLPTIRFRRTF